MSFTIKSIKDILNIYKFDNGCLWDTLLDDKITIISLPYDQSGVSNNITDMLLTSLYYYQVASKDIKNYDLRIFIDEIQKQNLYTNSPSV